MNNSIFFSMYSLAHRYIFLDKIIIFIADKLPYLVILAAIIFMLKHHDVLRSKNPIKIFFKKWKEILIVFVSSLSAWVLSYILKYLCHTPRPFDAFSNVHSLFRESGYAFPSGHATAFMALAMSIFFIHKRAGYIFISLAVLIGLARIIAGVHFPVDIIGGFAVGFLVAFFIKSL